MAPFETSYHDLPTYDEAILSDQGITVRPQIAPGVRNVLHHIDYSSDPEEARIHLELTSPSRHIRSHERCVSPQRPRRKSPPDLPGVSHHHHYYGNINVRQPPWTTDHTTSYRAYARPRQTPGGDDGSSPGDEGDSTSGEEVLVDNHHLITKGLKFQEEGELVDHLIEILEMMDHKMMKDIL